MAGLAFHPADGLLYGLCGEGYDVRLFRYDTKRRALVSLEDVRAEDGAAPVRIHHMAFADDATIFAGENDNTERSSYLWEIVLR
jgi:hypothetical protein